MHAKGPPDALSPRFGGFFKTLRGQLNFYRIHALYFTFMPLIFAAIFYASNGDTHISYIDALFNSVSSICVCGLATVDLSSLTPWQQALLFIQMCIGNPIVVSWVVVLTRRRLFMQQCEEIVQKVRKSKSLSTADAPPRRLFFRRIFHLFSRQDDDPNDADERRGMPHSPSKKHSRHRERPDTSRKVRADMIRRVDDAPKLVDPSGWISEGPAVHDPRFKEVVEVDEPSASGSDGEKSVRAAEDTSESPSESSDRERGRTTATRGFTTSLQEHQPTHRDLSRVLSREHVPMPRTQTIEFAPEPLRPRRTSVAPSMRRAPTVPNSHDPQGLYRLSSRSSSQGPGNIRQSSIYPAPTYQSNTPSIHRGFGFFPLPHKIFGGLMDRVFPSLKHRITRTLTMPRTQTIVSQATAPAGGGVRLVPYISFDAIVGRNSVFQHLTHEQLEELGGVEYKGLTALLWLIPLYTLGVLLLAYLVIAPYMSLVSQWQHIFRPPQQHNFVSPAWFSLFQIVSAFTNTGTSLVDQSMLPFQRAYPMIIFLTYLILAGNTAFPIFLIFVIRSWLLTKIIPKRSSLLETLRFLLDHPRRCYIYLFPSPQTWFLLLVVISLTLTDWIFFLVLDIGNKEIESLPLGVRMIDGLLQSAAVRSSGFAIVTISALAPAVRVAYVIMMYISVCDVRSTNVYEDQSLGIYDDRPDEEEGDFPAMEGQRMAVWGRHLAMHMPSADMWWLCFALFLVCVIERGELTESDSQFEIFTIVFELVSAYGGVGLSLGLPSANYSTSGAFRKLSKLVVCAVMLRGRHRGLPVAIDRAVVLPFEFKRDPSEVGDTEMQRVSTMTTTNVARGSIQADGEPSEVRKRVA
ncbi:cation transport protein-domain-containing protein [Vararia minispora EC-137]|uniref:Cation transport protein-domain-containing protein n=1 Tax=Vararia minispora EC-137 TaxID=1314806 RepID=A0ACB8QWW0_9AGAM|nr:cation transport protein-domain-containing protein [Vararia minispora EC-137]